MRALVRSRSRALSFPQSVRRAGCARRASPPPCPRSPLSPRPLVALLWLLNKAATCMSQPDAKSDSKVSLKFNNRENCFYANRQRLALGLGALTLDITCNLRLTSFIRPIHPVQLGNRAWDQTDLLVVLSPTARQAGMTGGRGSDEGMEAKAKTSEEREEETTRGREVRERRKGEERRSMPRPTARPRPTSFSKTLSGRREGCLTTKAVSVVGGSELTDSAVFAAE